MVWAAKEDAVRRKAALTLRICRIKVDLLMMDDDCIRERVRFESSDSGFPLDFLRMPGLSRSLPMSDEL